ncbi:MAG: RidA family protein [Pseudomonadota bacterium]
MATKKLLNPDWPRVGSAPFAQAVQVGDTVYVSGQVAQDPDGKLVGAGDMAAQANQIIDNIAVILALAGATLDDVVKITTYVTDMSKYGDYARVRAERFPDAALASATVSSPELVQPGFLIEIEAIAVVGAGS